MKTPPKRTASLTLFLYGIVFFTFFQLITTLVKNTYTFGLLSTSIPNEIIFVLFLLSPVVLILAPGLLNERNVRLTALITGSLALVCWGITRFTDTRAQMIVSGIGTGAALICIPALMRRCLSPQPALSMAAGLAFSVMLSILMRIENFGNDALPGEFSILSTAGVLVLGLYELMSWSRVRASLNDNTEAPAPSRPANILKVMMACLGIASVLMLLFFGFTSPVVIARWEGLSYPLALALAGGGLGVFLTALFAAPAGGTRIPHSMLLIWNTLFAAALGWALFAEQVPFIPDSTAYPLPEPSHGIFSHASLFLAVLMHPVLYIDFAVLAARVREGSSSPRALGAGLALAAVYQLALIFSHVFTTVYDYIPVIGMFFRDRFWLVYLIPCLVVLLAVLFEREEFEYETGKGMRRWPLISAAGLTGLTLFAAVSTSAVPVQPDPHPETLTVMTYNIQQGIREDGLSGFRDQLETIQRYLPDILGIQESDTARIANGNLDVTGFFAGNLGMYQYYGPKTVTGTFGIALLSRYPILTARTDYMYSSGEQTAVITAEIDAPSGPLTVMVTHLGNGGPMIQQEQVLQLASGRENVILMGDFNFRPDSEQYALTIETYTDAFTAAPIQEIDPPGQDTAGRIDHIFLSPGLIPQKVIYVGEGPSDHPAVFLELSQ